MAFSSSTVTIGYNTKKSDYDRLLDNTKALKDEAITLNGAKTFQATATFNSSTVFIVKPKVDGIQTRSATGSVSIECEYIDDSAVHSVIDLKTKVIEIGDWNMDATTSLNVTHGLTISNIRSVSVIIRNDTDNVYSPLNSTLIATINQNQGGYFEIKPTVIDLSRVISGTFDSVNYDSTSFNRGWVTILYEE